jgi:heme A synthase
MLSILVTLLILALVCGVIYWIITMLPVPAPFKNVAIVILLLIFVIYLLGLLFGYAGVPRLQM